MSPRLQSLLAHFGAFVLIAAGFLFVLNRWPAIATPVAQKGASISTQTALVNVGLEASTTPIATTTPTKPVTSIVRDSTKPPVQKPVVQKQTDNQAVRIENPYPFPPQSFPDINDETRAALVNILCMPRGGGSFQPTSGSGVIIDPRGVILTNAHVAQYVLLSQDPRIDLSCVIRSGTPATPRWSAEILYIPPVWVEAHAREIKATHPTGTGEHDYALLRITGALDGSTTSAYPYLPFDTREAIGFEGDQVLVASYPAEFVGGIAAQLNLYGASSVTTIGQLMTFFMKSVDLISLGGIIGAQSGSSGGAVVNVWGRLIALIATTSEGATTADRDLRAITLSYISRDLAEQTQFDLPTILGGDVSAQAQDFKIRLFPRLVDMYIAELAK
ncbi:MAG: trypsin-like peptidase domain-containing protein [bacterium]|nr:trypsin-like peptidase domain-containing protein [bacterium]